MPARQNANSAFGHRALNIKKSEPFENENFSPFFLRVYQFSEPKWTAHRQILQAT
jgi:hypothetical protein